MTSIPTFPMARLLRPALRVVWRIGLFCLASASAAWAAPAVQTAAFEAVAVRPTREVSAVVVPRNEARLTAEVSGTVLRWGEDVGASVKRGAWLVEIDPTDLRLARDRAMAASTAAQARADLAALQLQRARDLVAQGFFSREALSARETESLLAAADSTASRAALASAERALGKARVVAPFDASVRQRLAQVGEAVAPGSPLYVLAETAGAELSAQLSPEDATSLRGAGDSHFERADGSRVGLKLLRVGATLNPASRSVEVRLSATAPGADTTDALVPGRDGRLRWTDPRPHVPAALLVRRDGALGVFTESEGKALFVALPLAQEGRAAPTDLPGQTVLVTQGHQSLRHGDALAR